MFVYPDINPVIISLGPVNIHWYGVMYLIGFLSAWYLAGWRTRKLNLDWDKTQISDLIFYGAVGVIVGGRLGYMLFYQFSQLIHQPWQLFAIWTGGMSFHGGLLGVFLALFLFACKTKKPFFEVTDFVAPLVPIGLGAGRLGNFINGELWGRVTDVPWAMVYPHVDSLPRHPSEIYQLLTEGVLLFVILWIYGLKIRPLKTMSGLFLLLYGSFRFITEFFRTPDPQLGFIAFDWLTMGQLLCIPMIVGGLLLIVYGYRGHKKHVV